MALRRKTGGRTKGTPNRATKALREMILGALDDAGGQAYLVQCARVQPRAFLALLGRILPMQVQPTARDDVPHLDWRALVAGPELLEGTAWGAKELLEGTARGAKTGIAE